MHASDILDAVKIGMHWLIVILDSYYIVVDIGRAEFQRLF